MNLSTITNTALSVAGQAAGLGFKLAQRGFSGLNRLRGGGSGDDATRASVTTPPAETTYSPSAEATPAKATPAKATPAKATPAKATPAKATPAKATPAKATREPAGRFAREVSKPKRARALRHRDVQAASAPGPAQVEGATGHGGRPAGVQAENTPSERASSGKGRQAAPMGSEDDAEA